MTLLKHLARLACGNVVGLVLAIIAAETLKGGAALMNTPGTVALMAGALLVALAVVVALAAVVCIAYPVWGLAKWAKKEIK